MMLKETNTKCKDFELVSLVLYFCLILSLIASAQMEASSVDPLSLKCCLSLLLAELKPTPFAKSQANIPTSVH